MTGLKPHIVEEIMTSPVVTVPASMPIEDALHLMRDKKIQASWRNLISPGPPTAS
jgi:CBS domain-containing protein